MCVGECTRLAFLTSTLTHLSYIPSLSTHLERPYVRGERRQRAQQLEVLPDARSYSRVPHFHGNLDRTAANAHHSTMHLHGDDNE